MVTVFEKLMYIVHFCVLRLKKKIPIKTQKWILVENAKSQAFPVQDLSNQRISPLYLIYLSRKVMTYQRLFK